MDGVVGRELVRRMEREGRAQTAMMVKDVLAGDLPSCGDECADAYRVAMERDLAVLIKLSAP